MGQTFADTVTSGPLLLALAACVIAGLVSFASPCVVPLVPGYLSYLAGLVGAEAPAVTVGESPKRGRSRVAIAAALVDHGRRPDTPVAVVTDSTAYLPTDAATGADVLLGGDPAEHLTVRAQLLAARGSIAYLNGTPDAALQDYDKALAFLARDPGADPRERAGMLDWRGRVLHDLGGVLGNGLAVTAEGDFKRRGFLGHAVFLPCG